MAVTKEQIKNGLSEYLEREVVEKISDRPVMMVLDVLVNMLKVNPRAIDKALDSTILSIMLEEDEEGRYNLDTLAEAIISTMDRHGSFELKLPLVKNPLIFNQSDVRSLKHFIEGDRNE